MVNFKENKTLFGVLLVLVVLIGAFVIGGYFGYGPLGESFRIRDSMGEARVYCQKTYGTTNLQECMRLQKVDYDPNNKDPNVYCDRKLKICLKMEKVSTADVSGYP
jgi:hypothetical protein